jgi:CRP/FNR family transcriptional regulator, cyclic AMP receptor protein
MSKDLYIDRLKSVPLFASMSKKELDVMVKQADHLRYPARHTVVVDGAPGEEFWLVIEGELAVQRGGAEVAKLGPGDSFGELAVIDPAPRDATVVSTSPVELMVIGRQRFWATLESNPTLMRKVIVGLAHRLRHMDADDTASRLNAGGEPIDVTNRSVPAQG